MSDTDDQAESPIHERAKLNKEDVKNMQLTGEKTMDADHSDTIKCVALFINSQVAKSEKTLQLKYGKTLIHTHGTAVLAVLRAVLTFDQTDIEFAMDALKSVVEASSALRKEQSLMSSFSGMIFGGAQKGKYNHLKSMTRLQKHAEITYAESYLLKALLSLLTEGNMVTFVKEGLAIRQSYQIFKSCYKFLVNIIKEEGHDGLKKNGIDSHFISGVYLGVGAFNLMLSIMPAKLLRVFEVIGFGGHRDFGMQCLALCADWTLDTKSPITKGIKQKEAVNFFCDAVPVEEQPGTRRFMCDLMLTMYHVLLSTMIQLPGCNIPKASEMIDKNLKYYPESFMYLIFKGKISQSARKLEDAIKEYHLVVEKQKDWRQLAHVCFWDIGLSYGALGQWEKAAEYFDILFKENKWSPSIYLYLKAVMLYTADPVKYAAEVEDMLTKVPTLMKKVAGKSVPLEKFVARKARKFFIQKRRLLLPAYEILYMWNGFDLIPDEQLNKISAQLDEILNDLDKQQAVHKKSHPNEEIPYSSFYDDLCLARFFKGLAIRELAVPNAQLLVPEADLIKNTLSDEQKKQLQYAQKQLEFISLQADEIEYDHWILPFARYELGHLHLRTGNYEKARDEYQAALNGGYADTEAGKQKKKASMESSLHLRIHNAVHKLNLLEDLVAKQQHPGEIEVESNCEEDSDDE